MATTFSVTEHPEDPGVQAVDAGLGAHNGGVQELAQVRALSVIARAADGSVCGGAVGRTWGACCELQQLWVSEPLRGRGMGTELVQRFEAEARTRGCRLVYLTTFSFQAPDFYQRCGYRVVRETRGYPAGIVRHDLEKELPP